MQRVAIFQFNWGRKLVPLFIFALSILAGTLFLNPSHANAATNNTYKTETSDNMTKKVKALKYYAAVNYCTQNDRGFHTTISGDDIDKGPRWWMDGRGASVQLGQYIDAWGDKNGVSGCNGESDTDPGWSVDMWSVFGISISDKRGALESLGYVCTKSGGDYTCVNNDINSKTSKKGILYQLLHSPYLSGVNPLTESPDYKAVEYFLAMNSLTTTTMCKAKPGGSGNLVSVSEAQPNGTVVTSDWSIQNDGGLTRDDPAGVPLSDISSYETHCKDAAKLTIQDVGDYVKWVGRSACATSFPAKATDTNFLTGCAAGRANSTNYSYCLTTTFSSDASANSNMREACYLGQGLPTDKTGISSGTLCYQLGNKTAALLTACIKGSLNQSDPNYCSAKAYPIPEVIKPGQTDPNADLRAACIKGQKLEVTAGTIPPDGTLALAADNSDGGDKTSCGVEGIGWLVCPIISFMGDLLSNAFTGLADNFLQTDTSLFATDSGTYLAWSVFRNFANIAFVIVFLIIIFSQLTSIGVSNYGVKKLLPRIVIAAILVNLSYFICQIAVDLSNILGYSLKQVFDGIAVTAEVPTSSAASANGFGIGAIILGVIATATVAYFALSILIPILLGALVGVLMVVLLLIARKAIIILLIVLSPLAFVAFLLPNTESLFTKWRKLFMALLLLFPIISVVFGASSLASQIILKAGPGTSTIQILQIMAVGIAALPFFIVPSLLKSSLNGLGTVGSKISGFANKAGGNLGKAGGKGFANSRVGKFQEYRRGERSLRRAQIQSGTYEKGGVRGLISRGNRKWNESTKSGKFGDRALATGYALADKENAELVANAGSRLDNMLVPNAAGQKVPLSQAQMMQVATGQHVTHDGSATGKVVASSSSFDTSTRKAAIQKASKIATVKDAHALVDASASMSSGERKMLAASLGGSAVLTKAPYLGGKTLGAIEQGTATTRSASTDALKDGKISAEALSTGNVDSARELLDAAMATPQGSDERKALQAAYAELNKPDSRLRERIVAGGDHDTMLQGIRSL